MLFIVFSRGVPPHGYRNAQLYHKIYSHRQIAAIPGSAIPFSKGHPQFYQQLVQTYGDARRFHVMNIPFLLFNHHEHVQSILVEKADAFYKGKRVVKALGTFLGNGIFLSEVNFTTNNAK